jgi:hypothetical protein
MSTMRTWRERARRRHRLYPDDLPTYLRQPLSGPVVFHPALRRAAEAVGRG